MKLRLKFGNGYKDFENMKKRLLLSLLLITMMNFAFSQKATKITIPDIPGYVTLKGDFHTHTVFSDGLVWPTIRIDEAVNEGIDIIAVTDHIEYRYIAVGHNRSYEIEKPYGDKKNILVVKGTEITRSMPPGHFNALFITDAAAIAAFIAKDDFKEALQEVKRQGGFILWNHPGWKSQQPDTTRWMDIHTWLYDNGFMNGIEIFIHKEFYGIVFDWAIQKKLTIFANSDIHGLTGLDYDLVNSHRPVTLVFAKERTVEAVKEALFAGRTAAFTDKMVRGREEWLKPLFASCVKVTRKGDVVELFNNSDLVFELEDRSGTIQNLNPTSTITIKSAKPLFQRVKNFEVAPGKNLEVVIE